MMRNVLLALFFVSICRSATADSYIVTKEGKGIWSSSVRKDDNAVYYIDKVTGDEKTLPVAEIDGLVPTVQKGIQYKPEQIQSRIQNIRALVARHMPLTRDLNKLLHEWEAFQKGDPGFEKQINAIAEKFNAGDKGVSAYKAATMDLGMIKFKDLQGMYGEKIDRLSDEVKNTFITNGLSYLAVMAVTNRVSLDDFAGIKTLVVALSETGQKDKATALQEKIRLITLSVNAKEAMGKFATAKTVDAYLVSRDILTRLRGEVAAEELHKSKIDNMMAGLVKDIGRAQPSFSFDFGGFPMTKNDNTVLAGVQNYSSRLTFTSSDLDEQCFVFPLKRPELIRLNRQFSVPLRLVFNRAQPKERVLGVMAMIQGENGMHSHTVVLENVQIKNGHADVVYTDEFNQAEKDFVPAPSKEGYYFVYICLGFRTSPEGEKNAQWRMISRACRFSM